MLWNFPFPHPTRTRTQDCCVFLCTASWQPDLGARCVTILFHVVRGGGGGVVMKTLPCTCGRRISRCIHYFEILKFKVCSSILDFSADGFILFAHKQSVCSLHARHTREPKALVRVKGHIFIKYSSYAQITNQPIRMRELSFVGAGLPSVSWKIKRKRSRYTSEWHIPLQLVLTAK